jgi:hypothetical protein
VQADTTGNDRSQAQQRREVEHVRPVRLQAFKAAIGSPQTLISFFASVLATITVVSKSLTTTFWRASAYGNADEAPAGFSVRLWRWLR